MLLGSQKKNNFSRKISKKNLEKIKNFGFLEITFFWKTFFKNANERICAANARWARNRPEVPRTPGNQLPNRKKLIFSLKKWNFREISKISSSFFPHFPKLFSDENAIFGQYTSSGFQKNKNAKNMKFLKFSQKNLKKSENFQKFQKSDI